MRGKSAEVSRRSSEEVEDVTFRSVLITPSPAGNEPNGSVSKNLGRETVVSSCQKLR